jgi:hypothetical protein
MAKPNNPISNLLASATGFVKNNKLISVGIAVVALAVLSGVAFGVFGGSSSEPSTSPSPTPPSQTRPDTTEPTATPETDPVVANARKTTNPTSTSTPTPSPTPTPACPSISVADIATSTPGITWSLNGDTTILGCQTLVIPAGYLLLLNGHTLTNNGEVTIAVDGNLIVEIGDVLTNNGTMTNYSDGGGIGFPGLYVYGGALNNYGSINNMVGSDFTVNTAGAVYNYPGGTITNSGFIQLYFSSTTLYNTGSLVNQASGEFLYQLQASVYNYGGGVITNNGTFNPGVGNGNIYSADGAGACGTGLVNGTNSAGVVIDGTSCP